MEGQSNAGKLVRGAAEGLETGKICREDFSRPLDLKQVRITDGFWGREQELVRTEVIPYQWEALNDRIPDASPSYCMRNFKTAGKLMREKRARGDAFTPPAYTFRGFEALPEDMEHLEEGRFYGFVFQDSDFSKWIEAVGYSLASHPDPELEKTADEAIDIVCAAQAENGYLDTYYIINGMDRIFTDLRGHHELYCFGHLAEGAVSYYQATGKDKLLKAAERYADFILSWFGPEEGKCKGYPGHEIAEMALAKLYEVTGEEKYLELGRFFLEMRGRQPYYYDQEERERAAYEGRPYVTPPEGMRYEYNQAHLPVKQQTEAVGHAVRAVYLYSGMADVARLTQDEEMYRACRRLWDSIVKEKLYITGGIGGTRHGEAFSFPYDLPNDTAYSETCAAIGLAFFARRMLEIKADNRYSDVMELALYNTVLAGMALDGKSFFYVNPLEVQPDACRRDERKSHVKSLRQKWFGCACCPPNIARIVSSLGAYIYTRNDSTLFTHLYVGSSIDCELGGRKLGMNVETDFPWEGNVKITLHMESCGKDAQESGAGCAALAFRIPGWCRRAQAEVRRGRQTLSQWEIGDGQVISCSKQLSTEAVMQLLNRTAKTEAVEAEPGSAETVDVEPERSGVVDVEPGRTEAVEAEPGRAEAVEVEPGNAGAVNAEPAEDGSSPALSPENIEGALRDGYLYLTGEWRDEDEIYLTFPMEVRCVRANTRVREDIGRAAFLRGPVCYCMEEADNGSQLHLLRADVDRLAAVKVESSCGLGHEMRVLKVPGRRQEPSKENAGLYSEYRPAAEKETTITLLPYYAWSNRGEGEMSVWIRT